MNTNGDLHTYTVEISECLIKCIPVTAYSEVDAVEMAIRKYKEERLILDEQDISSVTFNVRTERKLKHGRRDI